MGERGGERVQLDDRDDAHARQKRQNRRYFKNDDARMMRRYRHGKAVVGREWSSAKASPLMARCAMMREVHDVLSESHLLCAPISIMPCSRQVLLLGSPQGLGQGGILHDGRWEM
jgi:hypothetical protein